MIASILALQLAAAPAIGEGMSCRFIRPDGGQAVFEFYDMDAGRRRGRMRVGGGSAGGEVEIDDVFGIFVLRYPRSDGTVMTVSVYGSDGRGAWQARLSEYQGDGGSPKESVDGICRTSHAPA